MTNPKQSTSFTNPFPVILLVGIGLCYLAAGVYIVINPKNYVLISKGVPLNLLVFVIGPILICVAVWLSGTKKWLKTFITVVLGTISTFSLFVTMAAYVVISGDKPADSTAVTQDGKWELLISPNGGGSAFLQSHNGIFSQRIGLQCSRADGSVSLDSARFVNEHSIELITSDSGRWLIAFNPRTVMTDDTGERDHCPPQVGHTN